MNKEKFLLLAIWLAPALSSGQSVKLQSFPVSAVRLLDSPFREAQQTDQAYMLSLNPDRLLAPYLASAGLPPKALRFGWQARGGQVGRQQAVGIER